MPYSALNLFHVNPLVSSGFFLVRELEINKRPLLGRIFVRIQGVVTGA